MSAVARARKALRTHGPGGVAKIAAQRARPLVRFDEAHVWYQLDLPGPTARPWDGGDGLRLVSPQDDAGLAPFAGLPTIDPAGAKERRAEGAEPWLVLEGDAPVFACWIFPERVPALAARGGELELPPGVVCLEDSVASPLARGRGIAPRTWDALADRWGARAQTMITKVGVENQPSRRAVTKAGFREVGVQRYRRRGPFVRVSVEVLEPGSVAEPLKARLDRG